MHLRPIGSISGLSLMLICILLTGCGIVFPERKPPQKIKIAQHRQLSDEWTELIPEPPLATTADIHLIGLKLKDVQGWADDDHKTIRLREAGDIQIDVEMVDDQGRSTPLFPNGIGEYVEFGKRAKIGAAPEPDFHPGETFSKLMLRSSKPIAVEEVVWMEFEF